METKTRRQIPPIRYEVPYVDHNTDERRVLTVTLNDADALDAMMTPRTGGPFGLVARGYALRQAERDATEMKLPRTFNAVCEEMKYLPPLRLVN